MDLDDPAENSHVDTNGNHNREKDSRDTQDNALDTLESGHFSHKSARIAVSPANNTLERVLSIYPYVRTRNAKQTPLQH